MSYICNSRRRKTDLLSCHSYSNDEDLNEPVVKLPHSLEKYTHMSSMLQTIKLSSVIRHHGDHLLRCQSNAGKLTDDEIDKLSLDYQYIWETAPLFFRLASQEGEIDLLRTSIMMQSWMLQQGIFHK